MREGRPVGGQKHVTPNHLGRSRRIVVGGMGYWRVEGAPVVGDGPLVLQLLLIAGDGQVVGAVGNRLVDHLK